MWRDIKQNKSQFITIFLMVLIGVMVYTGICAYMDGMTNASDKFYSNNNLTESFWIPKIQRKEKNSNIFIYK